MSSLVIRPVRTRREQKAFIRFQWTVNGANPLWVPPLLHDRRKLLDRKKNPFYRHAEMELFLAEREGRIEGRVAAVVNRNHNREHGDRTGFFGFFECLDDRRTAGALLDAAAGWLRDRGMDTIRGPASPSVNDEYGLLVDGFDRLPAVLMPYNPPSYAALLEGWGLARARDLYAYEVRGDRAMTEKLVRVSEAVKRREGLVFRSLNMRDFDGEVDRIRDLYNRAWEGNWGEVPMTEEEFRYAAGDLKAIVNPDLVVIAEAKGVPVGFGMSLPDLNQVLKDNRGGYLLPGLLRLALFRKRINAVRIVILGVVPQARNSGVGGVLFYETARRAIAAGCPQGEASWVLEDNVMMNRGAELLQGTRTKTYRVYERKL
ncbi:MAG: N-acetyltransferase [Bacteroidota bacterium]